MRLVRAWTMLGNSDGVSIGACTQVRTHALAFVKKSSTAVGIERTSTSSCTRLQATLS